jgi:hypothetical protein
VIFNLVFPQIFYHNVSPRAYAKFYELKRVELSSISRCISKNDINFDWEFPRRMLHPTITFWALSGSWIDRENSPKSFVLRRHPFRARGCCCCWGDDAWRGGCNPPLLSPQIGGLPPGTTLPTTPGPQDSWADIRRLNAPRGIWWVNIYSLLWVWRARLWPEILNPKGWKSAENSWFLFYLWVGVHIFWFITVSIVFWGRWGATLKVFFLFLFKHKVWNFYVHNTRSIIPNE